MTITQWKIYFVGLALLFGVVLFYNTLPHRFTTRETYQKKQPNILFILADDLGWNEVGKGSIATQNTE